MTSVEIQNVANPQLEQRTHYFESTFRFISFNWTVALNEITIKLDYFGKRKRKLHIWRHKYCVDTV